MEYKKLTLKGIPRVSFAHNYKTHNYFMNFGYVVNAIEVTYIDRGEIKRFAEDGSIKLLPGQSVVIQTFDKKVKQWSDSPVHGHCTVRLNVEFDVCPINEKELTKSSRALYPKNDGSDFAIVPATYLPNQKGGRLHTLIQKITYSHASMEYGKELYCSGLALGLLAEITRETIRNVRLKVDEDLSPGKILYSEQAVQYISRNIGKKINIEEISQYIGVSPGYLSNTFREVQGMTLGEYIIKTKLNHVKEFLISRETATLQDAAEIIGFKDANYLSRIFKKYTGMTVRQFRSQKQIIG